MSENSNMIENNSIHCLLFSIILKHIQIALSDDEYENIIIFDIVDIIYVLKSI